MNDLKTKYDNMLRKVNSWNPPTEDHAGFKKFMVEQILESIRFDCYVLDIPEFYGTDKWFDRKMDDTLRRIAYCEKEHRIEVAKTKERNKWVRLFLESLREE